MTNITISDSIKYVGVDDHDIDLFEGQYRVPDGVSYNSYLIMDRKIALMDTVDRRKGTEWMARLDAALAGRTPDYLVTLHMEPDHAANIAAAMERYPDMRIVGNAKTFAMTAQFFGTDYADRRIVVTEGDTLDLGTRTLQFVMAPMVHWPEVMVAYERTEKTLFSADAFGKFGALDASQPWDDEARRYFINIVGKYGANVQALLKKAAALDIARICPLHGPVLGGDLGHYIGKYLTWSSYEPEEKGVMIAYASIYGNTADAARRLAEMLRRRGEKAVVIYDLARCDMAEATAEAFRFDRAVLAACGLRVVELSRGGGETFWGIDERSSYAEGIELEARDAAALEISCQALLADPTFPLAEDLRLALAKVARTFADVPALSAPSRGGEAPALAPIRRALVEGLCVDVAYVDARGTASRRRLAPYGLFGLRGSLYLVAGTADEKTPRTYRLDRFDETHVQYIHETDAVRSALEGAGFDVLSVEGHLGERTEGSDRVNFI